MAQPPPAKRMKLAVPVGVGGAEVASPRSRRLRQTLLVVLFMVRVSVRTMVPASISQIGGMFNRYMEHAFRKYHEMISSELATFQGQVESKLETFQGQFEDLRHEVRQLARLCSSLHADRHTRLEPNQEHANANGSNTNIRLCFLNDLKPPIYNEKNLTAENNAAIKVAIFEGDKIITSGPLSKAKVEILVLRGDFSNNGRDDWTEKEFENHIVQGRDGQGVVLGIDRTVRLTNGEVELSQIRFKEGSCRTPSRKFIMAARVCKSEKTVRVREAIMKPVMVLDRRNEANEKRYPPRLDDDVYRLEEIAKNGAYHKRLHEAGISTVQGFLKALNKDANKLRKILEMENKHNSWSKMIGHAKECVPEDKQELKRYENEEGNVVLFFNCVHDLVGAAFPHDYVACEAFKPYQKALVNKWKERAHESLEGIPSDYVMKGNVPEPISSGTDAADVPVGVWLPNFSAVHLATYQVTGAVENVARGTMNLVTEPNYPNANYGPMITDLDDLNTHDYQGQGNPQLGQQQMISPSIGPDWQQNPQGPTYSPDPFELASMMFQDPSRASTSAPLNLEPPHHLPQHHQMAPTAAPAWPRAARPWCAEHEQGPSCSAFPGSGHGNSC
uniref:Calmodulin-binding protein n=1 Tax=Arundo donax TaxID=35708 RepID=A0A0A9GHG1_ARUDO